MKQLDHLLKNIAILNRIGAGNPTVSCITADSRQVSAGAVFVAVRGTQSDGHAFIETALSKGAAVIVSEAEVPAQLGPQFPEVVFLQVSSSSRVLGLLASAWFDHPSQGLRIVAVTGTNGKTTTATLLYDLFSELGYSTGLISTVENRIAGEVLSSTHTTPDAVSLQALLARMRSAGCTHVFMEASSHAIHQNRIAGLHLEGAIFSNITHDHLDYHGTFDQYIAAKKKLFDELPETAFSLVNADDRRGKVMVQNTRSRIFSYTLKSMAKFRARVLSNTLQGLHMDINGKEVWFHLVGEFNAYNLLAVFGAACLLGEEEESVLLALSGLSPARGRFERIPLGNGAIAIVDYAHTPDALTNVLETIRSMQVPGENLITVVGCGGNRDSAKRPVMGQVAARLSSRVILTSDNPRDEDPMTILTQMLGGVPITARKKVTLLEDREAAIQDALAASQKGDVVLVAGKGHETYQEVKGTRYPFDDREIILRIQSKVLS